jgi:hypothetical protein
MNINVENAKVELESAIAASGKQLDRLQPSDAIRLMLHFYRSARAEGCDMEQDGDMLLFQYGTYERHGTKRFELDITRQFILAGGEDEDFRQLSLKFEFIASRDLESIGNGDKWCASLGHVDDFEKLIAAHAAMRAVGAREDGHVRLTYECVG